MTLLLTGASGRLGTALGPLLRTSHGSTRGDATMLAPPRAAMDITDASSVNRFFEAHAPDLVVHAAAFTDVAGAESNRAACWRVNVEGTRHVAAAARDCGARLLHISTDYVFWGGDDRPDGGYRETDPVGPVRNYYALTKLVAEEAARHAPHALLVRTSFRASEWPHPTAYDDLFTGQDYVDVIASDLALLVRHLDEVDDAILHVVTERKSVYDLIARRTPGLTRGSRADAPVPLPEDISLNTDRWSAWKERWT